jgi:hypothetical protein
MPRSIIHVSVELSQVSGVTMRNLRLRRYAWMLWRQLSPWIHAATSIEPIEIHWGLRDGQSLSEIVSSYL